MNCKLQKTDCPFSTIKGCHYSLNGKQCAIQSGIDFELYASQVLDMTTEEIGNVRDWCCDMRDLVIANHCPITMNEINMIDNMTVDRMKTGHYIRQQGEIVLTTDIAGLTLLTH